MARKHNRGNKPAFNLVDYCDELLEKQHRIYDRAPCNETETRDTYIWDNLGSLASRARMDLSANKFTKTKVALGANALAHCRLVERERGRIVLAEMMLEEDKTELVAMHSGIYVIRRNFGHDIGLSHIGLAHRLTINSEHIDGTWYMSHFEQYAALPIEDSDQLQVIEEP